jgi:8-oxo-dGTP pyrophosphatase MutT (NUDIX family)
MPAERRRAVRPTSLTQAGADLPERLRRALADRPLKVEAEWQARPAAVLVPLYQADGVWHALFTRRTETVESHRGQVSFPGGQLEPGDPSPTEAALRETEEEIGLRATDVEILGQLSPLLTVTQFLISPVVGLFRWPYPLRVNQREVANAFGVPLHWLADPANREVRERQSLAAGPSIAVYYFKPYQGEVIWGATARITLNLLGLMREADLLQ